MTASADLSPALLRRLYARSNAAGLRQLALHGAVLGVLGAAVVATAGTWAAWPAMAALGVAEMALFTPLHETTHRTPFRSEWLNLVVGWVAGFVLVLPPAWFRCFHLAHHRHTQDSTRDPELLGAASLTRRGYWWRLTGLPYWAAQVRTVAATAAGRAEAPWIAPALRPAIVREARIYLGLYALCAVAGLFAGGWLLRLWLIPALLGQPALRALLLAEHAGCPLVPEAAANTRTTLTARALALLYWNANYHAEHHMLPGVPFHALPALHALVAPRLRITAPGYRAAHRDIRASLGGV